MFVVMNVSSESTCFIFKPRSQKVSSFKLFSIYQTLDCFRQWLVAMQSLLVSIMLSLHLESRLWCPLYTKLNLALN